MSKLHLNSKGANTQRILNDNQCYTNHGMEINMHDQLRINYCYEDSCNADPKSQKTLEMNLASYG